MLYESAISFFMDCSCNIMFFLALSYIILFVEVFVKEVLFDKQKQAFYQFTSILVKLVLCKVITVKGTTV